MVSTLKKTWLILFVFLAVFNVNAQDIEIKTFVDQTTVRLGEQIVFKIELSGKDANKVKQPTLPQVSDFMALMGSGGTSQNVQIINGRMSVTKTFTYFYQTQKEGSFDIPAVQVIYKNKVFKSQPIKVAITKGNPQTQSGANHDSVSDDEISIKAIVNKKKVYVNEPVLLTFRMYYRVQIDGNLGLLNSPEMSGFWVENLEDRGQTPTNETVINGKKYVYADVQKQVLFPQSAGEKKIGSIGIQCNVRAPRARSNSIFDAFDDPFFARTVRRNVYSDPVTIEVLPLPSEGKPADFSGAVGQFKMNTIVDKKNVKTNEAISLKVKISGTGNIKTISTPQVVIPDDFEQYDPTVSENTSRVNNSISGSKTFEYILVPRYPGEQKIKPFTFSYFDTKQKKYLTLTSPEIVINVSKGDQEFVTMGGSGLSKKEVKLVGQDIQFIKLTAEKFTKKGYLFYTSFLFYFLLGLPLVGLGVVFLQKRHLDKLSQNVAYARSRKANKMAMKQLSHAKAVMGDADKSAFYANLSKALLGFAANKLNVPEAGIISTELERLLRERNADPNLVEKYISLIKTCDMHRFASFGNEEAKVEDMYSQAKDAIIQLEKAL